MKQFDAIIIGAGHNGLVTAAYLAKTGKSVLVLERREFAGGMCVSEELTTGLKVEPVLSGGFLRPDIIRDLKLARFGLEATPIKTKLISILPDSRRIVLSNSIDETSASIAAFSKVDAARWHEFAAFMSKASAFLDTAYRTPMPRMPKFPATDGLPLAQLGMKLRSMGARDMYGIIRMLPMTAREFLDEWFETDELKAAIASLGIHNANLGVMSAGSAFNLLHQYLIRGGWGQPQTRGGLSQITASLEAAAQANGAVIRTKAHVTNILVENEQVKGVTLVNGENIYANSVVSSIDPRQTFLKLIASENLDPEFIWKAQNIKMRGVTARMHLNFENFAGLPTDTLVIAPGLNYLEHAYDAAKYGQISEQPYLEVTTSGNTASVHMQFAPYHLRDTVWNAPMRVRLEACILRVLAEWLPELTTNIKEKVLLTPKDIETTYSLSEGDPHHGQLTLDQFFFMRPLPGWSNHKTPIDGLYLCGSGTHSGGGISGIPGRNAARQIQKAG